MKTAYLCDINNNTACSKEWCVRHGGPCMATLDPKYAWKDINGQPITADDEDINEQADKYFKQGRHKSD